MRMVNELLIDNELEPVLVICNGDFDGDLPTGHGMDQSLNLQRCLEGSDFRSRQACTNDLGFILGFVFNVCSFVLR